MGLKGCQIILDNPWNTYYAGQTVNGRVELELDSPKKVRGIIIRFLGEANTTWNETRKTKDDQGKEYEETETLTGHEEYFQIQYYLLGGKNSAEIELPTGTHTYPFTCALPPQLPSSYEGEWGHVRYTIKATLDRPWKFDQDVKMAFTVISPEDLNQNPKVKQPFELNLEKSFCCFCCKSGPLAVVVSVPVTGFVSGQSIPIKIESENASNVKVNLVKMILRKVMTFHVHQPRAATKKEKVVISEVSVGPIETHSQNNWNQTINIPPLPPSNLVNCHIIDLDYELKVEADVAGPHRNLEGKIPIVLGTIPLADYQSQPDPSMAPTKPVTPVSPPSGAGGALGWNMSDSTGTALYPNIPPPMFNETDVKVPISDKGDNEHTQIVGGNQFAPRYPTYASAPNYQN